MIYDSTTTSVRQFLSDLSREKPITRPPAEFGESFMSDLGMFWRENLSISRDISLSQAKGERSRKIREIAGDDAFIKAITVPGDPATQQMIDTLAAQHPEIASDADLVAGIKERNRALREERNVALEHQTGGGKLGSFLGTAAGAMTDPLVLGTLPLGASWATGIVRTMLVEAGISAGVEALIQGPILRYKQELESPYDMSDALINIGGAAVGAGVLSGAVKATARAVGRFGKAVDSPPKRIAFDDLIEAGERIPNPTSEQRAAIQVLREHADTLRQSPFSIDHPALDELHLRALAKATDDVTNGRAVDVSEFIEQPSTSIAAPMREVDVEEALSEISTRRQVSELLNTQDVAIRVEGPAGTVERSARQVLGELAEDDRTAKLVQACLLGRGE